MGRRGYSLVEIMLGMVIVALLIGGALIPLQIRLEQRQIFLGQEYLRAAREAIYAFALAHRTGGRIMKKDGADYALPSGRPYLPCPDVTGDGVEDRRGYGAGEVAFAELGGVGTCVEQKGHVPWLTLGLRELDPWGNRLTYRVDRKFSHGLLGFDQSFFADVVDVTKELAGGNLANYDARGEEGAVVCREFRADAGCPSQELDNVLAGVYVTVEVNLDFRVIPEYNEEASTPTGLMDGAVFVVLSHGKDGQGAIGRNNVCRAAPRAVGFLGEIVNSYYAPGHPFREGVGDYDDVSCSGYEAPVTAAALFENQFVSRPVSRLVNNDVDAFDDIVLWVGSKQLIGYLARNGVLPLAPLDFLPYE